MDEGYHELLAQVASMYYEQDMTQNEIGAELGLSRVKIYRLLKQAKANQVVQIKIDWPATRAKSLEEALRQRFGLKEALVLQTTYRQHTPLLQRLGQLGARYVERILEDGMTLAICLGSSTYHVVNSISPTFRAKIRVTQAMGSMPFAFQELDSAALARQLAQKLGGEVLYLSSPFIADSPEAAETLRRQRDIERTLAAARQADVALVGIGNLDPATSGFVKAGSISPDQLAALIAEGAVGDTAGQIFTLAGELHPAEYNQRIIGLTLAELGQIPLTIAVASGPEKVKAILGGLRTSAIKVLCTDDQTASAVLSLDGA
jgi:DNA-binding transcriptional regulator LsrR (DeoR family)